MKEHIPFVNSKLDAGIVASFSLDVPLVRVSLDTPTSALSALSSATRVWIDAGVDALHNGWPPSGAGLEQLLKSCGGEELARAAFKKAPTKKAVAAFVSGILEKTVERNPAWVSVPQLPIAKDGSIVALNKLLATATGEWKATHPFKGQLVLPVILCHQDQSHYKATRSGIIKRAETLRERAGAEGVWVVDCSLDDQGSSTNERKRFPAMVAFHQELRGVLPKSVFVVAGPYWALNVVLWARGLAEYTAIGVGSGFQYYVPGGPLSQGKNRVVVPPLRRQAIASSDLTAWVTQAEAAVVQGSPTAKELADLRRSLPQLIPDKELAKRQIAIWYKNWIERLEQAPPAGRALALYQDLSAAYVAGREIQLRLPRAEKVTRPERVAQQLMMSCL